MADHGGGHGGGGDKKKNGLIVFMVILVILAAFDIVGRGGSLVPLRVQPLSSTTVPATQVRSVLHTVHHVRGRLRFNCSDNTITTWS